MANEVKIAGLKEAAAKVRDLARQYPAAGKRALVRSAEFIMTDSKRDYCPVKDGHLRASGHIVPDPKELKVTLGYGGPAGIGNVGESNSQRVGYAVVQHERKYEHSVGTDKYLQKPLLAKVPTLGAEIGADIKADIEGRF